MKQASDLEVRPLSADDALQISSWRYPPPYDVYDISDAESLYPQSESLFFAILDGDELVAFCAFGMDGRVPGWPYDNSALDVGMGLRPNLTGRGLGASFAGLVCDLACKLLPDRALQESGSLGHTEEGKNKHLTSNKVYQEVPRELRVTIAQFNVRAQRVWHRIGFQQVGSFERLNDGLAFVVMTVEAETVRYQ